MATASLIPDSAARADDRTAAATACCESLQQVRENIDRIDAQMIALMAERGRFVAEAGRFKPTVAAVHDGARVERIITRVRAMAAEKNLSPEVAEATYRAMIAAFTEYEKALVAKRPAQ
jgi:isochorismate pyruvate lyase